MAIRYYRDPASVRVSVCLSVCLSVCAVSNSRPIGARVTKISEIVRLTSTLDKFEDEQNRSTLRGTFRGQKVTTTISTFL